MKKALYIFLLFILGYHVLHTFFVYGSAVISPTAFAVIKDIVRIILVGGAVLVGRKYVYDFICRWKWSLLFLLLLVFRSVLLSRGAGVSWGMIAVGLKYDIWPLFILLSSVGVGYIYMRLRKEKGGRGSFESREIYSYFASFFLILLIVGLVWQCSKFYVPGFFTWLGYGPIGDYALGSHPPIYYRTGPGGIMRLQGIFSGPNNYGFLLVAFASIIAFIFSQFVGSPQRKYSYMYRGLICSFLFSLAWTISRGAWIGVGAELFLFVWLFHPQWKKYLRGVFIFGVFGLLLVASLKAGSTVAHFYAWLEGRDAFLANPWGYGLASAGPAIHREGIYLPENHYLQLLLDIGLPGLLLWAGTLLMLWCTFIFSTKKTTQQYFLCLLFWLGLVGLCVEGLFLHVFEDSMVNYLFFVPFGFLLGSLET